MDYKVRIPIEVYGRQELKSVEDALRVLGSNTKVAAGEMRLLESVLKADAAAGVTLRNSLRDVSQSTQSFTPIVRNAVAELLKQRDAAESAASSLKKLRTEQSASGGGGPFAGILSRASGFASGGLGSIFTAGLGAGVGMSAAQELLHIGKAAAESMKDLGELGTQINAVAIRTGLSTREVSTFGFAAKAAGSDIGALEMAMRALSRGLSENSDEGKKAKEQLEQMGIKSRDAFGNLVPMSQVFTQISEHLDKMQSTAERNTAAMALFGRAGLELLPMLEGLSENLDLAERAGLRTFGPEEVARMHEYHRNVALIEQRWEDLKIRMKEPIAAVINFFLRDSSGNALTMNDLAKMGISAGAYTPTSDEEIKRGAMGIGAHSTAGYMQSSLVERLRGYAERQSNITANDAYIKAGESAYGRTPEGMAYRLKTAQETEQGARDAFLNADKGLPHDKVVALKQAWQQATGEVAKYKSQLDAIKAGHKDVEEVASFLARMSRAEEPQWKRPLMEAQEFVRKNKLRGSQAAEVLGAGQAQSSFEWRKAQDEIQKRYPGQFDPITGRRIPFDAQLGNMNLFDEATGVAEASYRGSAAELRHDPMLGLFRQGSLAGMPAPGAPSYQTQARLYGVEERGRLRSAQAQINDPVALVNAERSIREEMAQKELASKLEQAKIAIDSVRAEYDAREEYQAKLDQAREEAEDKLLNLQKQRAEEMAGDFASIVMGAQSGGASGARGALRNIGTRWESTILTNVGRMAASSLNLPHATNSESTLGKILAGTPFGAQPQDVVKVTGDNTKATRDNTIATAQLYQAMTGQAMPGLSGGSGGVSGPGFGIPGLGGLFGGGSLGSGIFSLFGGSKTPSGFGTIDRSIAGVSADETGGGWGGGSSGGSSGSSIGGGIAGGASIGFGAMQVSKGGARNVVAGAGAIAGGIGAVMAALSPALAAAGPIGAAVGAGMEIASLFIPDPKEIRRQQIEKTMFTQQYLAPPAINVSASGNGGYADTDMYGNVRTSNLSPYPIQNLPYLDVPRRQVVPGMTTSQYGGYYGAASAQSTKNQAPQVTIVVQTMDAKSFLDHGAQITDALHMHLATNYHPVVGTLRSQLGR